MASRRVGDQRQVGPDSPSTRVGSGRLLRSIGGAMSRRAYLVISLIAVVAATLANVMVSSARPATPGAREAQGITWSQAADMPVGRHYLAVAASATRVYAVGGLSDGGYEARIDEYNPANNTWTFKTNLPEARIAHRAAVVNNRLYVMGGMIPGDAQTPTVRMLDLNTNQWYMLQNMPTGRRDFAIAVDGNFIFTIGGNVDGNGTLQNFEALDTNTNTWTVLPNMPTGRRYLAAGAYNNKVYAIGGVSDYGFDKVEVYDRGTGVWSSLSGMPDGGRYGMSAGTVNGRIYPVAGKQSLNMMTNWVDELDTATNVYDITANDAIFYRVEHDVATIGNLMYVVGGWITDSSGSNGAISAHMEIGNVSGVPPATSSPTPRVCPTRTPNPYPVPTIPGMTPIARLPLIYQETCPYW